VAWGGGETPALAGIVEAGRVDLAASCTGWVNPKPRLTLGERLGPGDAIVLLEASGIHANGLSLARKLAETLPDGYLTEIAPGTHPGLSFGEALLAPTPLYSPVTEALWQAGVPVHYASNITGHGWRKLLRHPTPLGYRVHTLPPVPPVLAFMAERAGHDAAEAYGTLNMGAGFALFVPGSEAARAVEVARGCGVMAWAAGRVEPGPKRLVLEPNGVVFEGESLQLR
jgi:phosphoribosylformylglycinamidine cyclo-ligase